MLQIIMKARNKVLATLVRTVAGSGVGAGTIMTHQDEVLYLQSRDAERTIKVHVYKSKNAVQPTAVLINFHGSGFVIPMHGTDDEFAMRIAKDTKYTVLDVQYRLAPEYPFPAGVHDAEDMVRYVLARPQEFDPSHVAVSGFSAGGNFALGLSGHVFPRDTFKHVLAVYPPIDLATDSRLKVAPDTTGKPLANWMTDVFNDCYCPAGFDRKQPLVSPFYIDGERFPDNMLVITCACDNLAPETETLVERIRNAPGHHNIVHRRMELCNHAWDKSYEHGSVQDKAKDDAYDLAVGLLNSD